MRDEAYETLYCSSVAFGMRKALQAQEGKEQLQERIIQLEEEKALIEATISDMKVKADQAERRNAELRESEEKKHAEEIAFLKKTNSQLKAQLEGIIATKKWTKSPVMSCFKQLMKRIKSFCTFCQPENVEFCHTENFAT